MKVIAIIFTIALTLTLTACNNRAAQTDIPSSNNETTIQTQPTPTEPTNEIDKEIKAMDDLIKDTGSDYKESDFAGTSYQE